MATNYKAIETVEEAMYHFALEFSYSKNLVLATEAGSDFIDTIEESYMYEQQVKEFMLFKRSIAVQKINDDCTWRTEIISNTLKLN